MLYEVITQGSRLVIGDFNAQGRCNLAGLRFCRLDQGFRFIPLQLPVAQVVFGRGFAVFFLAAARDGMGKDDDLHQRMGIFRSFQRFVVIEQGIRDKAVQIPLLDQPGADLRVGDAKTFNSYNFV